MSRRPPHPPFRRVPVFAALRRLALLVAAAGLGFALAASPARADPDWRGRVLHACENEDGYPPFTIRGPGGTATGYSVDLVTAAIAGTGLGFDVAFLPTKRCTLAIQTGAMDMSMEDTWNPDWAAQRLTTVPIYAALYGLYFDRTRHPEGLTADEVLAHPERYRGCGVLGEDYLEFPPGQVDHRAHWIGDAFTRVAEGECDFFPETIEMGGGYPWRGRAVLADPRFGFAAMRLPAGATVPPEYLKGERQSLYLYIRRGFPDAAAVIERINATAEAWRRTRKDIAALGRYVDWAVLAAAAGRDVRPAAAAP